LTGRVNGLEEVAASGAADELPAASPLGGGVPAGVSAGDGAALEDSDAGVVDTVSGSGFGGGAAFTFGSGAGLNFRARRGLGMARNLTAPVRLVYRGAIKCWRPKRIAAALAMPATVQSAARLRWRS
jgi:hypothetical protein